MTEVNENEQENDRNLAENFMNLKELAQFLENWEKSKIIFQNS